MYLGKAVTPRKSNATHDSISLFYDVFGLLKNMLAERASLNAHGFTASERYHRSWVSRPKAADGSTKNHRQRGGGLTNSIQQGAQALGMKRGVAGSTWLCGQGGYRL